jgi:hypothetical protein
VEYLWVPCSFLQQSGPRYVEVTSQGAVVLVPVRINSNLKAMTVEELLGQKKSMHVTAFRHFVHGELPHDLRRIADGGGAEARCAADLRTEKDGRVYSVQARPAGPRSTTESILSRLTFPSAVLFWCRDVCGFSRPHAAGHCKS